MNLRRKLLVTYGGLGVMLLLVAGVTLWSMFLWQRTNVLLEEHYERSLLLQDIRAAVFRAVKKVPDALTGQDDDAEEEFFAKVAPVTANFERWAALAHSDEEFGQVDAIRATYQQIISNVQEIFRLVKQNRIAQAVQLMEQRLENAALSTFDMQTAEAVASDQAYRQEVLKQVKWARLTDEIILALAAFGTVSLILLLFAYLASDLFAPLRDLSGALKDVASGDLRRRLPEHRNDELGEVYSAFNQMTEELTQRQALRGQRQREATDEYSADPGQKTPSGLILHRLLLRLKTQIRQLQQANLNANNTTETVTDQLQDLLDSVAQFTDYGFPLDLNLAEFDVRMLLYEVLLRFHEPFAQRGIGFEIDIADNVKTAVADRMKLREVLAELIRNAMAALPKHGGHIGLRGSLADDNNTLHIEVADDGEGVEPKLIDRAFAPDETDELRPALGLAFVRSIIEQHGGEIAVHSQPGEGTYVRIGLPRRSLSDAN